MEEKGSTNSSALKKEEVLMAVDVNEAIKGWVGSPSQVYAKLKEILDELGFVELPVENFESQVKDQYYSAMSAFL
jgi:hypothetical protein